MKVGDMVRVSGEHSDGWQNKVGVVIYVSEYMPAADVLFTVDEQMHFMMDSLEVIS